MHAGPQIDKLCSRYNGPKALTRGQLRIMWEKKHLRFITEMITWLLGKAPVCMYFLDSVLTVTSEPLGQWFTKLHCSLETFSSSLLMTFMKICPVCSGHMWDWPTVSEFFCSISVTDKTSKILPLLTTFTSQKWSYIYAYLINSKHEYTVVSDILTTVQNMFISLLCFLSLPWFSFLPSIPSTL